jgi:hypothetical protein
VPQPNLLKIVECPDATHSMVPVDIEDSDVKTTIIAVFAPRRLFVPGALADQRDLRASLTG